MCLRLRSQVLSCICLLLLGGTASVLRADALTNTYANVFGQVFGSDNAFGDTFDQTNFKPNGSPTSFERVPTIVLSGEAISAAVETGARAILLASQDPALSVDASITKATQLGPIDPSLSVDAEAGAIAESQDVIRTAPGEAAIHFSFKLTLTGSISGANPYNLTAVQFTTDPTLLPFDIYDADQVLSIYRKENLDGSLTVPITVMFAANPSGSTYAAWELFTNIDCVPTWGASCSGSVDASHTLTLTKAWVTDSKGNVIPNGILGSGSGVDYNNLSGPTVSPEPTTQATVAFILATFLLTAAVRRRIVAQL